jgi:hypothetical protein
MEARLMRALETAWPVALPVYALAVLVYPEDAVPFKRGDCIHQLMWLIRQKLGPGVLVKGRGGYRLTARVEFETSSIKRSHLVPADVMLAAQEAAYIALRESRETPESPSG